MTVTYPDYASLVAGSTLANGDSTTAASIGLTNFALSNGTLTVVSDAPSGQSNSIEGSSQGTSGTSYVTVTISPTGVVSISVYWKMSALGSTGAGLAWLGAGGTRICAMNLLSTEQVRFVDASNAIIFTTTYSGAFVAGQWYRTDFHITIDTASTGRLVTATYAENGTTPLANTSYDSGAALNLGTAQATIVRNGTRSSTGTADDGVRTRFGWDPAAAYLIGPQQVATGYTKTPADSVGLTDVTTKSRNIVVNDSVGLTDTSGPQGLGTFVTVAEPMGLTDAVTSQLVLGAVTNDTVGIADTMTLDRSEPAVDTVGISDVVVGQLSRDVAVVDAVGVLDVAGVERGANAFEQVGMTDVVTNTTGFAPTINDVVGITDTTTRNGETGNPVSDGLPLTDVVSTAVDTVRDLTDNEGLTDAVSATAVDIRGVAEAVALTDAVTSSVDAVRSASDSDAITDAATVLLGTERAPGDPVALTDVATAVVTTVRAVAEGVGITDAASAGQAQVRTAIETIGMTDGVSVGPDRSFFDGVGMTDVVTKVGTTDGTIDALPVTDTTAIGQTRGAADAVGLSETVTVQHDTVLSVAESVGVDDDLAVLVPPEVYRAERVNMTDVVSVQIDRVLDVQETVGVIDVVANAIDRYASLLDSVGITDALSYLVAFDRAVNDVVTGLDSNYWETERYRAIDDGIGLEDEPVDLGGSRVAVPVPTPLFLWASGPSLALAVHGSTLEQGGDH